MLSELTRRLRDISDAVVARLDAAVSSRMPGTTTHRDRLDTNVGSRASDTQATDLLDTAPVSRKGFRDTEWHAPFQRNANLGINAGQSYMLFDTRVQLRSGDYIGGEVFLLNHTSDAPSVDLVARFDDGSNITIGTYEFPSNHQRHRLVFRVNPNLTGNRRFRLGFRSNVTRTSGGSAQYIGFAGLDFTVTGLADGNGGNYLAAP